MSRLERDETRQGTRIPVASNRAPLVVRNFDHDNFAGRWVDDRDDRIAMFLDAGYEFVPKSVKNSSVDKTVDSSSGLDSRMTKPGGKGKTLYLMQLPKKFFNEDQLAKQKEIDDTERAIYDPGAGGAVDENVDYGQVSLGSTEGRERVNFRKFKRKA